MPTHRGRDGCPQHQPPKHEGKDLVMTQELLKELTKEGFCTRPPQLKGATKNGFAPPGDSRKVGGKTVYPHFG